eukprot:CAMPEP_0194491212 /NCGR_PEP_ID=MMETSP0253-20130528/10165_1 /TAXON_ID=2966 /ORGANISM="Noctiluca scintillans" /LENGTH=481 /DNA_ID=CAMNT_0039331923 /DNA_START=8 /DNA_END=1453 /DNA_ORIENTATION=+
MVATSSTVLFRFVEGECPETFHDTFTALSCYGDVSRVDLSMAAVANCVIVTFFDLRCAQGALAHCGMAAESFPAAGHDFRAVAISPAVLLELPPSFVGFRSFGDVASAGVCGEDLLLEFFDTRAAQQVINKIPGCKPILGTSCCASQNGVSPKLSGEEGFKVRAAPLGALSRLDLEGYNAPASSREGRTTSKGTSRTTLGSAPGDEWVPETLGNPVAVESVLLAGDEFGPEPKQFSGKTFVDESVQILAGLHDSLQALAHEQHVPPNPLVSNPDVGVPAKVEITSSFFDEGVRHRVSAVRGLGSVNANERVGFCQGKPHSDCFDRSKLDIIREKILSGEDTRTTVMMRGFPKSRSRKRLAEMLRQCGFRDRYDFVYLPFDKRRGMYCGFVFINLKTPMDVLQLHESLQTDVWAEVCDVKTGARPALSFGRLQGRDELIGHFGKSAIIHDIDWQKRPQFFKGPLEAFSLEDEQWLHSTVAGA